tara:strand:- start:17285 stop:17494 length:210 start_codon:yes stop_codon:yes gene_type:complete
VGVVSLKTPPFKNKIMEKKIDTYIEWFRTDNSDPYGELKWLIDLLLNSKHKKDIETVLEDNYNWYKSNK